MSAHSTPVSFARFQRWVVVAIVGCIFLYVGFSIWSGLDEIRAELSKFNWWMFVVAILLTLTNYTLRFVKWHYLLGRLGVDMPWVTDAWNFVAGLSMAVSPGKAGELLKPYVVKKVTNVRMARTTAALVTERLTDAIAMLLLAGVGITTYAADKIEYLVILAVGTAVGLLILTNRKAMDFILDRLEPFPIFDKIIPRVSVMLDSMRTCVAPMPLLWTVALSIVAWSAECFAYQLIFKGMGIDAGFDACFFVYAFATVGGAAMPGGLGIADGALIGGAMRFILSPSLDVEQARAIATTAALLTRIATLWFGVALGAIALLKVSSILKDYQDADDNDTAPDDVPDPLTTNDDEAH